jgi:choline kinase
MRAIILSAGQGRRLLPHTAELPKCLLPVEGGRSILEVQLAALAACGIDEATVMVGFGAALVESFLHQRPADGLNIRTRFNPFFATSDNLATCWLAGAEMDGDFLLLNGDTLFENAVLKRLLAAPRAPVSLAVDRKPVYTEDDMKVTLGPAMRLINVGKKIPVPRCHAESIGLMRFDAEGARAFRDGLERAVRDQAALKKWYLDVLNDLAPSIVIKGVSIQGLWWSEIDSFSDLAGVRAELEVRAELSASAPRSKMSLERPASEHGADVRESLWASVDDAIPRDEVFES